MRVNNIRIEATVRMNNRIYILMSLNRRDIHTPNLKMVTYRFQVANIIFIEYSVSKPKLLQVKKLLQAVDFQN